MEGLSPLIIHPNIALRSWSGVVMGIMKVMREQVDIYSMKKGMIALDSPIKNKILQKLSERELAFEELIEVCGKARSTMSVHLNDLLNMGLVYKRIVIKSLRQRHTPKCDRNICNIVGDI